MEELITISDDSPANKSIIPENNGTVPYIKYDVLVSSPYKYTAREFFEEVHFVRRNRRHLKIERYSLKRIHLLKKYGWGLHINENKKIALIPCESEKYRQLLEDPSVKKTKAYRNNRNRYNDRYL